jgi:hypothetical protein
MSALQGKSILCGNCALCTEKQYQRWLNNPDNHLTRLLNLLDITAFEYINHMQESEVITPGTNFATDLLYGLHNFLTISCYIHSLILCLEHLRHTAYILQYI